MWSVFLEGNGNITAIQFLYTLKLIISLVFFPLFLQIDEDPSLVPESVQGGTFGFNSSTNVPTEGFQF